MPPTASASASSSSTRNRKRKVKRALKKATTKLKKVDFEDALTSFIAEDAAEKYGDDFIEEFKNYMYEQAKQEGSDEESDSDDEDNSPNKGLTSRTIEQDVNDYLDKLLKLREVDLPEVVQAKLKVAYKLKHDNDKDKAFAELESLLADDPLSGVRGVASSQVINNLDLFEKGRRINVIMSTCEKGDRLSMLERISKLMNRSTMTCRRYQYLYRWWSVVPVGLLHEGDVGPLYRILEASGSPLYKAFFNLGEAERQQLQYQPFTKQTTVNMSVDVRSFKPAPFTQIANKKKSKDSKKVNWAPHNVSKLFYKGNATLDQKAVNSNLPFENFVDVGDTEDFDMFEAGDEAERLVQENMQQQPQQQQGPYPVVNFQPQEQPQQPQQPPQPPPQPPQQPPQSPSGLTEDMAGTDMSNHDVEMFNVDDDNMRVVELGSDDDLPLEDVDDNYNIDMTPQQQQQHFADTHNVIQGGNLPVFGGFYLKSKPKEIHNINVNTINRFFEESGVRDTTGFRVLLMKCKAPDAYITKFKFPEGSEYTNPIDPRHYDVNFRTHIVDPVMQRYGQHIHQMFFKIEELQAGAEPIDLTSDDDWSRGISGMLHKYDVTPAQVLQLYLDVEPLIERKAVTKAATELLVEEQQPKPDSVDMSAWRSVMYSSLQAKEQRISELETEVKHLRLMFFELKDQVHGNMVGMDVRLRQFNQMLSNRQQQQPAVDHMKQLIDRMLKAEKIPLEDIGYVTTMSLPPIANTDAKEELERRQGARKLVEEIQMTIPKGYLGKQPKDRKEEDYTQEQSDLLRSQLQSLYSIVWPEKRGMQKYAEASAAGPADDGPPVYHPDPNVNIQLM